MSDFYSQFTQAEEAIKRQKVEYFLNGLIKGLTSDLDKSYIEDSEKYDKLLTNVKKQGFKVLRNSLGKHKVILEMDRISPELMHTASMAAKC